MYNRILTIKKEFVGNKKTIYLLTFFFITFRLVNLTKLPIFNDEAIYLNWGWREINIPHNLYQSLFDSKQPLLMWIFGLSQKIISHPLLAGRLTSVTAGFLCTCGIYLTARDLFGKKVAPLAFIFYSTITIFVFFDRQALMESSMSAVGVWSFYSLLKLFKTNNLKYSLMLGLTLGLGFFIKSSALIFYLCTVTTSIFILCKHSEHKNRWGLLLNISLSFLISQLILIPLYSQKMFWKTLSRNDRFVLTFSEIFKLPVEIWAKSLLGALEIMFWQLNPFFLISTIIAAFMVIKKSKLPQKSLLIWIFSGLSIAILTVRNITPRHLVSFLPLLTILVAHLVTYVGKKGKIAYLTVLGLIIIPSAVLTLLLLFSPLHYFNHLNNFTGFSQKKEYVTFWTSGYGIPTVVNYINSKNQKLIVAVRLDAGNPESAMFTYFNRSNKVKPIYLDSQMFDMKKLEEYECLESSMPIYFISRDNHLAGLNNYLIEIERFYKPEEEHSIGVYVFKSECIGKSLVLF